MPRRQDLVDAHGLARAAARPGSRRRPAGTRARSSSASFIAAHMQVPEERHRAGQDEQRVAAHQPGLQERARGARCASTRLAVPFTAPSMSRDVHAASTAPARCRPRPRATRTSRNASSKPYFALQHARARRRNGRPSAAAARRGRASRGTRRPRCRRSRPPVATHGSQPACVRVRLGQAEHRAATNSGHVEQPVYPATIEPTARSTAAPACSGRLVHVVLGLVVAAEAAQEGEHEHARVM